MHPAIRPSRAAGWTTGGARGVPGGWVRWSGRLLRCGRVGAGAARTPVRC